MNYETIVKIKKQVEENSEKCDMLEQAWALCRGRITDMSDEIDKTNLIFGFPKVIRLFRETDRVIKVWEKLIDQHTLINHNTIVLCEYWKKELHG
jgi:hypothetical protein